MGSSKLQFILACSASEGDELRKQKRRAASSWVTWLASEEHEDLIEDVAVEAVNDVLTAQTDE